MCIAHSKCPPGKYTKATGNVTTEPTCETCITGFFKALASNSSLATDSCLAHTKCPPGKYTEVVGNATAQPECQTCDTGFFKASKSTSSIERDSCVAHTKCPPGKYTTAVGSITAQPECKSCTAGFFKSTESNSSMCAGTASRSLSTCPAYAMQHDGYCYATMDKCPFYKTSGRCARQCQNYYISMPTGWTVAPDTADIRSKVVARGKWGTSIIVLGNGRSYRTQSSSSAGSFYSSTMLHTSGSSYKVSVCNSKVLMRTARASLTLQGQ